MIAVVGVCRMTDFTRRKHQMMTTQKHIETVTTGHKPGTEQGTKHDPKLITANPGVFLADFLYVFNDYTLPFQFRHDVGFRLVESLTTTAKQTAGKRDLQAAPADQFRYYLAPDFFRMGMLKYSSARVIIKSRATSLGFQTGEGQCFLQLLDALLQLRVLFLVIFFAAVCHTFIVFRSFRRQR